MKAAPAPSAANTFLRLNERWPAACGGKISRPGSALAKLEV